MMPSDLDLIYWESGSTRKMSAYRAEWLSTEMDAKGAIGPLAKEVVEKFPGLFASQADAEMFLTVRHFQNMGRGQNRLGLPYPTIIGTGINVFEKSLGSGSNGGEQRG